MKTLRYRLNTNLIIASLLLAATTQAQSVNKWRGDETAADWNNQYNWKLNHIPTANEPAHFRENNSVIIINSTIQLNNGMHLYGKELSLQGNGKINLWNPISHRRTVNIPASAKGDANLTLNDNISLNAQVALAAKGFGTSACKGSITLKDRTLVKGILSIGNKGTGTGQVFVKGNSTYRITGLELATKADSGGSAEIHVLGGTVRIETKENPFTTFLKDPSRKIILGDSGTLRIEFPSPISFKKKTLTEMISKNRLIASPGSCLTVSVIQEKMMIIRGEDERNDSGLKNQAALFAAIDKIPNEPISTVVESEDSPEQLAPLSIPLLAKQTSQTEISEEKEPNTKLAGYIVTFGGILLTLRRPIKI